MNASNGHGGPTTRVHRPVVLPALESALAAAAVGVLFLLPMLHMPEPYQHAVGLLVWAFAVTLSFSALRRGAGFSRGLAGLCLIVLAARAIIAIVLIYSTGSYHCPCTLVSY
jgi:hypothetical protein